MSYLTPATPIGLYGPFHCLSASTSTSTSPGTSTTHSPSSTPPPSRASSHSFSSTSTSSSMSTLRSIQSINRILSARRQRYQPTRSASSTSVLPSSMTAATTTTASVAGDGIVIAEPLREYCLEGCKPTRTSVSVKRVQRHRQMISGGTGAEQADEGEMGVKFAVPPVGGEPLLGLMEPRPQEAVVSWGIGEVLWGGRH